MAKINEAARTLGTKGGKTTLKKHGKKHFQSAGKKGNSVRWNKKRLAKAQKPNDGRKPVYLGRHG